MLLIAVIVVVIVAGLALTYLSSSFFRGKAAGRSVELEHALQIAEAGLGMAIQEINAQKDYDGNGIGNAQGAFGGGTYSVTATKDPTADRYTLRATGTFGAGKARRGIEAVIEPSTGAFWTHGVFSDKPYRLDSNAYVDSYDSEVGSYASQISGNYKCQSFAKKGGHIGSNEDIHLDSNAKVFGNANPGPGYSVTTGANAYISGATTPQTSPKAFPTITLPPAAALPPVAMNVGSNKSATIASGNYHFSFLTTDSNSTLTIKGPAVIVVDHFSTDSNSSIIIDATDGPVEIYGTGSFRLDSNSSVSSTTQKPSDLSIFITTDNYTGFETDPDGNPAKPVKIGSNAALYAAVYAPNAIVRLDSNGGFFGAIAGKKISQDSNFGIHYDEALGKMNGSGAKKYKTKSWREYAP